MYKTRIPTAYYALRIAVLVSVTLNVLFNFLYERLLGLPPVSAISEAFPVLFTPAGYAFSVWGLIYLAFVLYAVIQLLPSQLRYTAFDRLSIPFILLNILLSLWIVLFTSRAFIASNFVILLALFASAFLFRRAWKLVFRRHFNLWLQFPFSLTTGWLVVAGCANILITLRSFGIGFGVGEGVLTCALIICLSVTGFLVSVRSMSLVFPAVLTWALIAVYYARIQNAPDVSSVALVCGILVILSSLFAGVLRSQRSRIALEQLR